MIERNIKLLKWDNFFGGLWPLSTLAVVYFQTITQSYALAMAVFSLCSLSATLTEIPTGILSDKIGRRKTLIWSGITIFLCFVLWAWAGEINQVWMLFVGAFLWGISNSLLSGTDEALIYETMEELGRKEDFDILFSKSGGWNQIGSGISALLAAITVYFFSLQTLAWISVVLVSGQLAIAFLYIEPKRTLLSNHTTTIKHFLIAFRQLWRHKKLRFYALMQMMDNSIKFSSYRFESVYYESLIPLWLVNIVRLFQQMCGTISFFIVPRIKKLGNTRIFFGSMVINTVIRFIGLMINNVISPFILGSVNLVYGTAQTSGATLLQKEFSSSQRATMKSIVSFVQGIIIALMMYVFGVIMDFYGSRNALLLAVFASVITLIMTLFILKKVR